MKHHSLRALLVAIAPLAVAGSLAGYSTIGCGCVSPSQALAENIGLPRDKPLTIDLVRKAVDRTLRGKEVNFTSHPLVLIPGECKAVSSTTLRCVYWLWER